MMQLIESTKEMFRDSRFLRKALMIACPVALQGMLNTVVNLVDTLMILNRISITDNFHMFKSRQGAVHFMLDIFR